jgi:microcompartment protein CcmK/EutM
MRFGKVIGRVVLSQQDPALKGGRWLVVVPMGRRQFADLANAATGDEPSLVVYDNLGAGEGDVIGFTEGGEAMLPFNPPIPVDATNALIVDQIQFV